MSDRGGRREVPDLRVPADWAEVTPEWMTTALRHDHPDAEVATVRLVSRDDGTNRRARFELTYHHGSGPGRVFLKAEGAHREVHSRNGNLFNEPLLFASGVPLEVEHARVHAAVIDRPRLDYVLVMEDVTGRGGDPRDATRPLTVPQAAGAVRALARLHSRYWQFDPTTTRGLDWVNTWAPTAGFQAGLRTYVPTGLARGADRLPDAVSGHDGDAIVDLWARYVAVLHRDPVTLLHADAHIGNLYVLPDDEVGFLDWQVVRRGAWSQDVGYFLMGALTVGDRREHETALLATYLDALEVPAGTRPTWDDAWLHYRACAAYGSAIWLSTLGTDGYQPREVSLVLAQRYGTAFADLGTESALAALE
ncbi:aminoglycoside phosphotransferase [Nocardia sp. NPDC052254]|uniref:aminoglycoside phosphotransferase n=1 Tax=Nocardia sp. NPDC052254 TaxID=3155681 RepID=UPI00343271DB